MTIYQVHFVDHGNNVRSVECIERATDAEAIEAAHKMNVPTFIAGFDVWEDDRLVHRHRKSPEHGIRRRVISELDIWRAANLLIRPKQVS